MESHSFRGGRSQCTAFTLEVYNSEKEEWEDWFSEDGVAFDDLEYEFGDLRVKPASK